MANGMKIHFSDLNNLLITFANLEHKRCTAGVDHDISPDTSSSSSSSESESEKRIGKIPIPLRLSRDPANRTPLKGNLHSDHNNNYYVAVDAEKVCLSFGGCGFLGSYQFGAAKMIHEHGKELMKRVTRFAGCSSGSLVATLLFLNPEKISVAVEEIYKMADKVNEAPLGAMTPGFTIGDKLRAIVEQFIPDDISIIEDKLFVSATKLKDWSNVLMSKFDNKKDLIDCLMASCYHPMYSKGLSGKAPIIKGERYIDGGYSNILPEFLDCRTVSVTAFAGDADVCPAEKSALFNDRMFAFFNQNMKLTLSNAKRLSNSLFPPTRDVLQQYFQAGSADAEKLLRSSGMYT
uniref:PNPLA domain-containing protein n=1 Tax=Caenorhabditis japonica TaxID=281687 RepID=A0A8R1HL62_CAEJA